MRLRDNPIIEVTRELTVPVEAAWALVTDIELPTRAAGELQRVEWLDGAERVELGARFRGYNRNDELGEWSTVSVVTDVEPGRRWVWSVGPEGESAFATWGFEVDPHGTGSIVRQWAKFEDGRSPFSAYIDAHRDKEGLIIDYRLGVWRAGMVANLDALTAAVDRE